MPKVEVELVEEPEPGTPFGAKGVGEPSNVVAPAAIVSALRNALGRELQRIPVRPDDLVGLREPLGIPPWPPFPERPSREPSPAAGGHPSDGGAVIPGALAAASRSDPSRSRVASSSSLAGCTSDGEESRRDRRDRSTTSTSGAAAPEPIPLEVFVYNVEYGGDESTDAVIEAMDADIVGVLESYNRLPEIAANTGYPYYNVSLQLLSKYPIHEPSGAEGRYALIEVRPGEVVAFFNIHLDYVKYGPKLLRQRQPVEEVLASEDEVRTSALDDPLRLMDELIAQGYPVFFTGDHNEPSSLDWTEATAAARPDVDGGGRLAGERGDPGARLPRHVPRGPSRPRRGSRDHARERRRPDRLRVRRGSGRHARQPARRGGGRPRRRDRVRALDVGPPRGPVDVRRHARPDAGHGLGERGAADPGRSAHGRLPVAGSDGTVAIVPSEGDTGSAVLTEDVSGSSGTLRGRHGGARTRRVRRGPDRTATGPSSRASGSGSATRTPRSRSRRIARATGWGSRSS